MANSNAGKGSGGCMKIGCAGLVVLGVIVGYIVLFIIKPIIAPPPIVAKLPADTVAVISVNAVNGLKAANEYRNAIGPDRLGDILDMLKSDEDKGGLDIAELAKNILKYSQKWAANEIAISVGSIPADPEEMPEIAFMVNSRNMKAAEANVPEIIKLAEDAMVQMTAEAEQVPPEEIEMPPMVFDAVDYGGTVIHCQEYEGVPAEDDEPGLCWTSTKGMLAVTMTRTYAKKIVDSSMGNQPAAEKLTALKNAHVPGNAVFYMIVNGQQVKDFANENIDDILFDMVEADVDTEPMKEIILGEIQAFDGVLLTFGFDGLDPQMKTSIMLDPGKSAASKYLKKVVEFESDKHSIDELINKPGSIASLSVNNLDKMAVAAIETLKEEAPEDYGEMAESMKVDQGIDLEKVAANIGPELGLSLNGLTINEVCSDVDYCEMPFMPYMLAAVKVVDPEFFKSIIDDMIAQMSEEGEPMFEKKSDGLYTFVMPPEDESEFPPELQPAIAFGDGFILAGTNLADVEKCLKEKCGVMTDFVSNIKVSVSPSGAKEVADAYMAANREYADDPDAQKVIDDLTLKIFDIFGITHYIGITPAEISLNSQIHVDKDALVALPIEDFIKSTKGDEEAADPESDDE